MFTMYPVTGRSATTSSHLIVIEVFVDTAFDLSILLGLGGLSPKAINASSEYSEYPIELLAQTINL